ncbi:TetR/AcrR family transcriptional regulator [Paenibacillus sp. WLX2291]|uniref:TetR/AcrR family transcriptional regulator n=1 Tax=Paenibacillus sp. WLX2291 TaxID=3296934 RepID=UPI00398411FE
MGNEERNTYVKKQITNAFIELLKQNEFSNISISDITNEAQVSRNSFYRNYIEKEDILLNYIHSLLQEWRILDNREENQTNEKMYGSLFAHLKANSDFYILLKNKNLFHLFLKEFLAIFGSKPDQDNLSAYIVSFIAYGTYGWIEEWIARGMQESAESMTTLLSSQGQT